MKMPAAALCASVLALNAPLAHAGTVLVNAGPGVSMNTGDGFRPLEVGADIPDGTRLLVKLNKNGGSSKADIRFADGCVISLSPGQVFSVGDTSPCEFRAQTGQQQTSPNPPADGLPLPFLLGWGGLLVGGTAAALLLRSGGSSNPYWALAYMSH